MKLEMCGGESNLLCSLFLSVLLSLEFLVLTLEFLQLLIAVHLLFIQRL